jgi:5-azacytidine-induced protein 1
MLFQAEQEATCASLAPSLLASDGPATAAAIAAALLPGSASAHHHQQHHQQQQPHQRGEGAGPAGGPGGVHTHTRRYETASATSTGTRQVTSSSRPGTAHTGASQPGPHRSVAVLSDAGTAPQQRGRRRSTRSHHPSGRSLADGGEDEGSETGGRMHDGGGEEEEDDDDAVVLGMDDDAVSVATRSTAAGLFANRCVALVH